MKKQRSNNKFLKIAAVSLALLALPPLVVYGQTVRCRAAQPRPALPGVMSDEIRLDPDVYGGLDTLSNVVIGPDGTIYTPGGEYGTF